MNFPLPWLLWRRAVDRQQDKLDKVIRDLAENKTISDLAKRDPELREALRGLGVKNDDD
jgi:hypothetical protein